MSTLLTVKAFHIVFVVSWFSALFYAVRLFIYHTEALDRESPEKEILTTEYKRIERLLWNIISNPAMVGTLVTGLAMIWMVPGYLQQPWMHVKLSFVLLLLTYHFICARIRKRLVHDKAKLTSFQLRLWNEVATILLVIIVLLVVQKSAMDWVYGTLFFIGFAVIIMSAVKIVKRFRK